jgi:hypothetical protein
VAGAQDGGPVQQSGLGGGKHSQPPVTIGHLVFGLRCTLNTVIEGSASKILKIQHRL